MTENIIEKTKSVAAIIGAQVLDLALDEAGELIDNSFKCTVIKFVENSKVLYSVPLTAPLFIVRAVCHCYSNLNEIYI